MPKRKADPRPRGGQPIPLTPEKILAFCVALSETCNVGRACAAIGVSRTQAYDWRHEVTDFEKAWDAALQIGVSALEDEAHRRGFEGVAEPVFHQGVSVGTVQKYSDTLAIFLLKAHAPEKYRERQDLTVKGTLTLAELVMGAQEPTP